VSKLSSIITGAKPGPRRMLVYGTAGIGKSTFATNAPAPIVLQTEDGLGEIDCHKFPVAASLVFEDAATAELYTEEHDYRTVVVDSLDWLERLIWARVCENRQVANIEDIGYGKGYAFAISHWRDVLEGLSALREAKGMTVILIAHTKIERFENPETDAYDRFNKKRVQGIGDGERVLRTTERPSHLAKNRLGLPDELPLAWSTFTEAIDRPVTQPSQTTQA